MIKQLLHKLLFVAATSLLVSCQRGPHTSGSGGRGYGNLYVNYGYSQQGSAPRKIQWAIVFSETPSEINSLPDKGVIRGKFKDGSQFEAPIGGGTVFWIAPGANVRKMETDSISAFVETIENTQNKAVNLTFDGPSALTDHLRKSHVEPTSSSNGG